jgi:hypothetical protein
VSSTGGPAERAGAEGCLDGGAHGINVDPDPGQRVPVQVTEQAAPAKADDLRLGAIGGYPVLAQDGAGRLAAGSEREQVPGAVVWRAGYG